MDNRPPLFPTIVAGAALSPHTDTLLRESWRFTERFGERLVIVHVATGDEARARRAVEETVARVLPADAASEIVVFANRKPVEAIIEVAREQEADLILAGALAEESLFTRLTGSIARRLAREAPCSVLLLPCNRNASLSFRRIVVSVDASDEAERALDVAAYIARWERAEKLVAVWEYEVLGLAMAMTDESDTEAHARRSAVQLAEEDQLNTLLRTADISGVPVEAKCRYGDRGWIVSDQVRTNDADLLVIPAPAEGAGFLDRLLAAETGSILRHIESALLLVRQRSEAMARGSRSR